MPDISLQTPCQTAICLTMTYLLRLNIVDRILRSSAPTLDDDGEQGDDEAGRKHGDFIEVLSIDKTPLSLQSLLAVHFILLHNRINIKLLNLLVQKYDKIL